MENSWLFYNFGHEKSVIKCSRWVEYIIKIYNNSIFQTENPIPVTKFVEMRISIVNIQMEFSD